MRAVARGENNRVVLENWVKASNCNKIYQGIVPRRVKLEHGVEGKGGKSVVLCLVLVSRNPVDEVERSQASSRYDLMRYHEVRVTLEVLLLPSLLGS